MKGSFRRWSVAVAVMAASLGAIVNAGTGAVSAASGPLCSGVGSIGVGYAHAFALRGDGTAWGFGNNSRGQLAIGSPTLNRPSPVAVSGLSGATAVSGGYHFTVALFSGGAVKTAGLNNHGQLGDGTVTERKTLVSTGIANAAAVDAGGSHALALLSDGTVKAWGRNVEGQLGDGGNVDAGTPQSVPGLSGVAAVAAGWSHSLALKTDGTVWAWGLGTEGQLGNGTRVNSAVPVQVTGLTGVAEVDAGVNFSVARLADGTVKTWGANDYGQLGFPGGIKTTPTKITSLAGVTDLAAGSFHGIATAAGRTWVWGSNASGQLGTGDPLPRQERPAMSTMPIEVAAAAGASSVAAGATSSYAVRSGTVWAWGENSSGQLGDGGAAAESNKPVQSGCPTGTTTAPAYAVALAADPPVAAPGTPVTLHAVANQDVGPSPYEIQIFDKASGVRLASCATGVVCAAVTASPTVATKTFVAYIATSSLTMPPPFVQSSAETVVVWGPTAQGPWSSSCTTPTQTVVDSSGVLLQIQQVSEEETWICFRSSSASAWVGGRATVVAPSVTMPPVSVDEMSSACAGAADNAVPGPHPTVSSSEAGLVFDLYASGLDAWACLDAGDLHRRVVVTGTTTPPGVILNLDGV